MNRQRNARCGTLPGAEIRPVIRLGGQAMVDMHCIEIEREGGPQNAQQMQQHHRIAPARQPQREPRAGRNVARQTRRQRRDGLTWRRFP